MCYSLSEPWLCASRKYIFIVSNENNIPLYSEAAVLIFKEKEGVTFVIKKEKADKLGMPYNTIFCQITLNVYSDLNAVGLIAAVSSRLAQAGISVNPVSAFYHDHLFIPASQAQKAIVLLEMLSAENSR
jgi:hypothetical protein